MAVINTNLVCDLQKAVKVEYIDGVLFSQDNQANQINVTVLDGGEPATISGTVSANIIRSDGGTVAASGGSITGNVASITLPAAAYAVPGVVSIVVKLTASGVITTIAAFVANMYRASTDTAIDPGTVIPSIQTLISQINTAVASIPADYSALWTKLAPAFSTDASYVAGQYVTYNSGLYRFNTSHSGSWSSSDVTAVNLGGEITNLKSALCMDTIPLTQGGYIVTSGATTDYAVVSNAGYGYAVVDCVQYDMFVVDAVGASTARQWAFVDTNGKILEKADASTTTISYLVAPANAVKLIINSSAKTRISYKTVNGKSLVKYANAVDANINAVLARITENVIQIANPTITDTGKMISAQESYYGQLVSDSGSDVSDYIPVIPCTTVIAVGAYVSGNRSISAYDKNKQFKGILMYSVPGIGANTPLDIEIPEDVWYIRITIRASGSLTVRYSGIVQPEDKVVREDIDALYNQKVIARQWDDFLAGIIDVGGKTTSTSATTRHTNYLDVIPGSTFTISNLDAITQEVVEGGETHIYTKVLFVYDSSKRVITAVDYTGEAGRVTDYEYTVPFNAAYIRFNISSRYTIITYAERYQKTYPQISMLNTIIGRTNGYFDKLFDNAMSYPAICLIDDDTLNASAVKDFHDFCVTNGIVGSYAVQTSRFNEGGISGSDATVKSLLLQYEAEGFSTNVHCYLQTTAYSAGATRDMEYCNDDMTHALRDMQEAGFINYRVWCSPGGNHDDEMMNLARQKGLECLISSGYLGAAVEIPSAMEPDEKWHIKRNAYLLTTDTALRTSVNTISANNGWLLICTHFHQADNQTEEFRTALSDFIAYAKSKGCVFKAVNEEYTHRKPIYDLFEML